MSWQRVPLRRIFRIVNGGTPTSEEEYWNGDVPWATPVDIGAVDGAYLSVTQRSLTREGVRAGSRTVPEGSLILSTRAPIGYVAQTKGTVAFNQGCRGLVAIAHIDARYFRYQLISLRNDLIAEGAGSTFVELSTNALASVCITVPPPDEQRRIADFLDVEVAHIDKLVALQGDVRASVLLRAAAQLDIEIEKLAADFGSRPFRRLIRSIEQGTSPQCDNVPAEPGVWGVLKVSAVKHGVFTETENKQLPDELEPERRYEIKSGDLLITRANTPQLVGAVAIADSPRRKLMLCDKIFRVDVAPDVLKEFIVFVALSSRIRAMCAESSHGTSQSMANLKTDEIKRWPIPAAPISVQRSVINELSAVRRHASELVSVIDRQLALLAERRQALISAAVTGQIDVTTAGRFVGRGGAA